MIRPDMAAAPHFSLDLAAHRGLQRLAYGVLERVDAGLRDGMTERDVAMRIERRLAERGILELRPGPFVWFGDRSAGSGLGRRRACAPSLRTLETGMPLILGVAFRFHHYSCHAAHSTCFGENPALERARADLARVRARALEVARREGTIEAIERGVNELVADAGLRGRPLPASRVPARGGGRTRPLARGTAHRARRRRRRIPRAARRRAGARALARRRPAPHPRRVRVSAISPAPHPIEGERP